MGATEARTLRGAPAPLPRAGPPRSPTAFLPRAAAAFPDRTGVVDGDRRLTWSQLAERAARLAVAVAERERVAFLGPPGAELLEACSGVPAAGAVLVAIDARLGREEIAAALRRERVELLLADRHARLLGAAAARHAGVEAMLVTGGSYEAALAGAGGRRFGSSSSFDEDDPVGIAYSVGPVRILDAHRDACLDALAEAHHARLDAGSTCLWALPTVHCGGWSFPWVATAVAARHVIVRTPDPAAVWKLLGEERITHLCAAPALLDALAAHPGAHERAPRVLAVSGATDREPAGVARLAALGIDVQPVLGAVEASHVRLWSAEPAAAVVA